MLPLKTAAPAIIIICDQLPIVYLRFVILRQRSQTTGDETLLPSTPNHRRSWGKKREEQKPQSEETVRDKDTAISREHLSRTSSSPFAFQILRLFSFFSSSWLISAANPLVQTRRFVDYIISLFPRRNLEGSRDSSTSPDPDGAPEPHFRIRLSVETLSALYLFVVT